MTYKTAVAAPFRHTRKGAMKKNELVYYYAVDRKWMSKEQADVLLRRAEEDGLLRQDNGVFSPAFNIATITIPIGFKPTSAIFEQNDPSQELIARIARKKQVEDVEVVADKNRLIRERFDGNLLPPAALVLLAKEADVPFEDLSERLVQAMKKP